MCLHPSMRLILRDASSTRVCACVVCGLVTRKLNWWDVELQWGFIKRNSLLIFSNYQYGPHVSTAKRPISNHMCGLFAGRLVPCCRALPSSVRVAPYVCAVVPRRHAVVVAVVVTLPCHRATCHRGVIVLPPSCRRAPRLVVPSRAVAVVALQCCTLLSCRRSRLVLLSLPED